jgi:hypothetical protein
MIPSAEDYARSAVATLGKYLKKINLKKLIYNDIAIENKFISNKTPVKI